MWTYNNQPITCINDMKLHEPKTWGFVYHLTLFDKKTNQICYTYIGKKNIFSTTNPIVSKAVYDDSKVKGYIVSKKRKKGGGWNYKKQVVKESDWKTYCSSNKFIQENKQKYNIQKEILMFCTNDFELKYREAQHIICSGALDSEESLNNGVSIRMFNKKVIE